MHRMYAERSTHVDILVKTGKRKHYIKADCKSKLVIVLALVLIYLLLICGLIIDIQTDTTITLLGTSKFLPMGAGGDIGEIFSW